MHDSGKTIYRYKGDGNYDRYEKTSVRGVRFQLMGAVKEIFNPKPISVRMFNGNCVRFRSKTNLVGETRNEKETFWDVLEDGGGDRMWEFVDEEYKGQGME